MTFAAPTRRRPSGYVLSLGCLLLCLLGGGTAVFVAARGENGHAAGASVREGLGRRVGGDFVGFFVTGHGTKMYCLSPRARTPRSASAHTVAHYPGVSRPQGAALAYALAQWGDARTRDAAAVESQVLNTLAGHGGEVARRAASLPAALRRLTTQRVAEARIMRGPYVVRVRTTDTPLPGTSGLVSVTVRSATGAPVARTAVDLASSANAALARSARTDVHGGLRLPYRVTDVGEVRLTASVSGLAPTAVRVSRPKRGEQRLATWSTRTSARATTSLRAAARGFTHRYECTSTCDGRPAVTLGACAAASTSASRVVFRLGGRLVPIEFPASPTRACRSITPTLADRTQVSASWQYRTARGWSHAVDAGGGFVVDCPPTPEVRASLTYDCAHVEATAAVTAADRPVVLEVSGDRRARLVAEPGHSATWTMAASCGAHLRVTVRGGVSRAAGGWNFGRAATLVTP